MKEINIAVSIPCSWDFIPARFFEGWVALKKPPNYSTIIVRRGRVDDMRNKIIDYVLDDGRFTHILFLDVDHYFPSLTIKKLLEHDLDIVSGISFRRSAPYDPTIFKWENEKYLNIVEWQKDSLIDVDGVGAACLLVKVAVLKRMVKPYFEFSSIGGVPISEDLMFCRKAKELGYSILVDTSATNKHIGCLEIDEDMWICHGKKVT
jgi:hypothetical protein